MNRTDGPQWFAQQMSVKLAENEHKGVWENCDVWWLLARLKDEVNELEDALKLGDLVTRDEVIREAADVGNFAMMIADVTNSKGVPTVG